MHPFDDLSPRELADRVTPVLIVRDGQREALDALVARCERLEWIERRIADVKAALEGKDIVDASLVRSLL